MNIFWETSSQQLMESKEQCVLSDHEDSHDSVTQRAVEVNDIYKLSAANQLKPISRPTLITARVIVGQPILYKLPQQLNTSCEEVELSPQIRLKKPSLGNKQSLLLKQFIANQQLELIYSKKSKNIQSERMTVKQSSTLSEDFTARVRNLNRLNDYNWKNYRELKQMTSLNLNSSDSKDAFQSMFETGNLSRAYRFQDKDNRNYGAYILLLEKDINTHGYTNWFHFRMKNSHSGIRKFFIVNIVKKTSFYKQGMRISIFSKKKLEQQQVNWFKGGDNIHFFQTKFLRFSTSNEYFNCLYFEYDFDENDEVYFAANQPYSYSRLSAMLNELKIKKQQLQKKQILSCQIQTLGHSIANNIIPFIKIGKFTDKNLQKDCILIIGRQHPSEIAGSYISEYLIKSIIVPNKINSCLLEKFNFIFIPMVNPDGVIYGNSRCNLAGFDLNRQWGQNIFKEFTPETYRIRSYMTSLLNKNRIHYVFDLHGHGKKLNSFFFCCGEEDRISNRIYPMLISRIDKRIDLFACTYGVNRDKETTIRGQLNNLGAKNALTLQSSYYGYFDKEKNKVIAYTENDYRIVAQSLFEGLMVVTQTRLKQQEIILEEYGFNTTTINSQLALQIDKLEREQKKNIQDRDLFSDSDPEGDVLNLDERLNNLPSSKLAQKIKETYKKIKNNGGKNNRNKKSRKRNSKNASQSINGTNSDGSRRQSNDVKLQGRLILSKKKTQNKFKQKQTTKLLGKGSEGDQTEKKIFQKIINPTFNTYSSKNNVNQKINSSSIGQYQIKQPKRIYDRARIFSRIKTQVSVVKEQFKQQIIEQSQQKQQRKKSFNSLREESLKAMIKQPFSILGLPGKTKKCKWIQEKKSPQIRFNSSMRTRKTDEESNTLNNNSLASRENKSCSMIIGSEKKMMPSQFTNLKDSLQNESHNKIKKYRSSNKKYERFENFLQKQEADISPDIKNQNIFYYFPVL